MPEKMFFYLLIACGILSQGIIEAFPDGEIKQSSDFLVREKRVVSHVPGEDNPTLIKNAPYVVVVKHILRSHCVGSILSKRVVITAASCVTKTPDQYQIGYGKAVKDIGHVNHVRDIKKHFGIALLIVAQPFVFSDFTNFIQLHEGPLLPGIVATVRGWGFNWRSAERGTEHLTKLRSIQVPIMAHQDCVNRYKPHIMITDKEVCTYDSQRHCGHTDFGAGLVVDGYLAGVHVMTGIRDSVIDPHYPDVFAVLQHVDYRQWIMSNLQYFTE